jgi:hypothetical protein
VVSATTRPLYSGNKQVSSVQEGGPSPGPVGTGADFSPPRGSIRRPLSSSESLYRMSYPDPRSRIVGSLMEYLGGSGRDLSGR